MALHDAVLDLQRGRVDYAVVGGSSAIFRPATSLAFLRLKCAPLMYVMPASMCNKRVRGLALIHMHRGLLRNAALIWGSIPLAASAGLMKKERRVLEL